VAAAAIAAEVLRLSGIAERPAAAAASTTAGAPAPFAPDAAAAATPAEATSGSGAAAGASGTAAALSGAGFASVSAAAAPRSASADGLAAVAGSGAGARPGASLHGSAAGAGSPAVAAGAGAGDLGWRELLARLPPIEVPAAVEAAARLGAAVHGAHRLLAVGPKAAHLAAWCDAALNAAPGVATAMIDLLAARAAPLPAVLSAAQGRNLASGFTLGLQHGWRWEHVDAEVGEAIAGSLARRADPAVAADLAAVEAELIARRGLRPVAVDLLAPPYYLWEPLERFFPDVMPLDDLPLPATLRAPWPETTLCLITDGAADAAIELTARLPPPRLAHPAGALAGRSRRHGGAPGTAASGGSGDTPGAAPASRRRGTLRLTVNGAAAGTVELATAWRRTTVRLPRHLLRRGRNRLTLHWPPPPPDAAAALAAALDRLDQGIAADLHPVFGELYSVFARTC
jgi:hypothetical protein